MESEKVFKAAEALVREGKKPTVRLILERIGGSMREITPALREWREQRTRLVSPKVQIMVKGYKALDVIEKESFRDLTQLRRMTKAEMLDRLGKLTRKQGIKPSHIAALDLEGEKVVSLPKKRRR